MEDPINITTLCGKKEWVVWNNSTNDFGTCFFSMAVVSPAHAILAIISAYFIGLRSVPFYLRTRTQKWVLYARGCAILGLAISPILYLICMFSVHADLINNEGISKIVEPSIKTFCWLIHFIYVMVLLERISSSIRGKRVVQFVFIMVAIVDCLQCRSIIMLPSDNAKLKYVTEAHAISQLVLIVVYVLTLLPSGDDSESHYEELLSNERTSLLRNSSIQDYGGFHEDNDPNYLGVAKEGTSGLSKIFFYWVNPLIKKGRSDLLKTPDDVFDIPPELSTEVNSELFQQAQADPRVNSVLRALGKVYGKQFFLIGLLKLLADCAGFASPILLNKVVSFMETKTDDIRWGYAYAIGLTLSTFVVALSNTHFNLQISELKLKVRAAVVTAVYRHTVSVSSVELNKFSVGEVMNYMSTDTDRIVNFGPSLHAVWSLPFQLAVTIGLLYQQLGVSSLAGVGITILMIPLNKFVADKIGSLSTKMMSAKDNRVQIMSELLFGVRVVKYFGWEPYFSQKVIQARTEELKQLRGRKYLDAVCVYLWATTPVLISVVTFALFALLGNDLTAARVFTSVALFSMLTGPLNAFPWAINGLVESVVSIRRITEFLSMPKKDPDHYYTDIDQVVDVEDAEKASIAIAKATFSHGTSPVLRETEFRLDTISLDIATGELVGIIGKVGSGKSSLLSAILGEMTRVSGQISVNWPIGGTGFVQQEPWLQKGSVRDNILFGKTLQQDWYDKVVDACALKDDLKQLHHGDMTNVGEQGSMLSGGQKARIALARAVYQDKELYFIDDIFSAIDKPVGMHIYRKCINGLLKHKTRILCTHHPRFLGSASKIVVMEDGKVSDIGPAARILPKVSVHFRDNDEEWDRRRRRSIAFKETIAAEKEPELKNIEVVVEEETTESGAVAFPVYKAYWNAVGFVLSPAILITLVLMQATRNYTDLWLAHWVSQDESNLANSTSDNHVNYYLTVYGSIAAVNSIFSLLRAFLFAYGGICAAKTIHERLMRTILKAKTSFFDRTPMGRILNRFSSDLYTVDDSLPFILNILLAQIVGVIGPILVCIYAVPWICLVLVPLAFILYDVQFRYRPTSRQLKRMGSVSLSPIYAHFADTLSGLLTIRAMKTTRRFLSENEEKLEASQKAQYAGIAASQWLELRLQLLGTAVVTAIATIAIIQHHTATISPGLVGLAISYALGITGKLSGLVSAFTETEKEFVAVERCKQYIEEVATEDFDGGVTTTPYNWPSEGTVVFKDVNFRYADHLPCALKDLSFATKGREKVGIIGRTGAGKSSLFQVLFRTTEILKGAVTIDGVNLKLLNLRELRSNLAIIPQTPFLFKGAVRENLDPLGKSSDAQLWDALRKSYLATAIDRLGGLDGVIEERGRNLSVGQRQLMCLARAILSTARVVCVDEATANVDLETDKQIQDVLRSALHNCTVITIAHRVETVMGSDRVIVMANGQAIEEGHPNILLQDRESKFSKLIADNY